MNEANPLEVEAETSHRIGRCPDELSELPDELNCPDELSAKGNTPPSLMTNDFIRFYQ